MYVCPGCEARLQDDEIVYPVPDVQERVLPGEPMPAGACPNCEELIDAESRDEVIDAPDEKEGV